MDFHLVSPNGITVNDIVSTVAATVASLVAWKQKVKDEQISNRDEQIRGQSADISQLKAEIERLKSELEYCYQKRQELADKALNG